MERQPCRSPNSFGGILTNSVKVLTLLCFATAGLYAQAVAGLGGVSGSVRDASGAAVPNATVVLTNDSKGIKRTLQTTDAGVFSVPALVPAPGYSLTVNA